VRGRDARLMMLQRPLWSLVCDRYFRLEVSGWERLPAQAHIPLPAKIRTELLDPIEVEHDPERASDVAYVDRIYREVQAAIQAGMNRLAVRRRFPVFG
jgi:hypothetical protein